MTHTFNPEILRGYDVRGIYQEALFVEDAYHIGLLVGSLLGPNKMILVGSDCRKSSADLCEGIKKGLRDSGALFADAGRISSPGLTFLLFESKAVHGTIMVTGSHNPLKYNGFKIFLGQKELQAHNLQETYDNCDIQRHKQDVAKEVTFDAQEQYQKFLLDTLQKVVKKNPVVWSSSGGVTGEVLPLIADQLQDVCLGDQLTNVPPDPTLPIQKEAMCQALIQYEADWGVAFDGDGDRCVLFYRGMVVPPDYIVIALVELLQQKKKDVRVVLDTKFAVGVTTYLRSMGVEVFSVPTGHTYVRSGMYEHQALFGAELSGHYFFPINNGAVVDDGVLMGIRLMSVLPRISELLQSKAGFVVTPELRCKVAASTLREASKLFAERSVRVEHLSDNACRYYGDAFVLFVRPSRTENLWSLRLEATTEDVMCQAKIWLSDIMVLSGYTNALFDDIE